MQYLFATFTVSDRLLHALSWTLLHSLWQGALVALLAGILFYGFAHLSASIRYNLLLGMVVFFLGMVAVSFWGEWAGYVPRSQVSTVPSNAFQVTQDFTPNTIDPATMGVLAQEWQWEQLLDRHKALLLFVWSLVLILKSIKMSFDIAYTYKIRMHKVSPMAPSWNSRLQALAQKLGIRQKVHLLESGLIQGPATLGFLRPLILLPLGLVNHLTVAQVEAILLHELAHIRRSDYLVNMLQCLLENIFFFNPGLLWLSYRIREERENCCDDLALQVLQDKQLYALTLLRFQEYQWYESQYAQAFGGNRNPLLTRIKRILDRKDYQNLFVYEKIALIFSLFFVGAFLVWAEPSLKDNYLQEKSKDQVAVPLSSPNISMQQPQSLPPMSKVLGSEPSNLNPVTSQMQPEIPAQPSFLYPSSASTEDSIPTTSAELAQLQADLAVTTKQYEREKSRYDSIKAVVENTEERVVSTGTYNLHFQEHVIRSLGNELIADGIIKDAPALRTFRLDETTFKVNGRKLPKELIEKYQQRYLKKPLRGNYLRIMKVNQRVIVQRIDTAQTNQ